MKNLIDLNELQFMEVEYSTVKVAKYIGETIEYDSKRIKYLDIILLNENNEPVGFIVDHYEGNGYWGWYIFDMNSEDILTLDERERESLEIGGLEINHIDLHDAYWR